MSEGGEAVRIYDFGNTYYDLADGHPPTSLYQTCLPTPFTFFYSLSTSHFIHPIAPFTFTYLLKIIKVVRIEHKGEARIRIDLPNTPENNKRIRQIPGRTFSGSLQCWHIPYDTETHHALRKLFPELSEKK